MTLFHRFMRTYIMGNAEPTIIAEGARTQKFS